MILPALPIRIVDLVGSILMIVFSFLCLHLVFGLRRRDEHNVLWIYLLIVCFGLAGFAISRAAGHILQQILKLAGYETIWDRIRPLSGAFNTFTFVFVASVTLFFQQSWKLYQEIAKDKDALQEAHHKLLFMNQNLETLVTQRTEALTVSEQKYRRIFEVSRDMILVVNTDGSIVNINPSGRLILGCLDNEPVARRCLFPNFFIRKTDWDTLRQTLLETGQVLNAEYDLRRMDGSGMRALISGSLDRGGPDSQDTIHFMVKDIEERRMMKQQMAQADKLASIGELSAGVAHEINNPLGIILGYTQFFLRSEPPGSERYEDFKTIEKHVRNCRAIIEDLLNFARSSEPKKEMIRINEVADDVLNFLYHHSDPGQVEIIKNYAPDLPPMLADEKKIKQVLLNLVMNAKHAVGKKGTIRLSTQYDPATNRAAIQVSDTGYGIGQKDMPRIFDPFFSTKATGQGTGLGLSVSYGIIKSHGGDILVESQPGMGATFTVSLPVVFDGGRIHK
jgi:two-component system NtrC family sensor kinase